MSWANPAPEKVFFFSRTRHKKHLVAAASIGQKKHRYPSTSSLHSVPDITLENEQNDLKADDTANAVPAKTKTSHLMVEQRAYWTPTLPARNKRHHRGQNSVATTAAARAHTEVLDLSHDPYRSFVVHFDDPHWRNFSSNLKPLGLNILLNSCNLHAEYIRFIDHVHAISAVVPRTVAVVNRRCKSFLLSLVIDSVQVSYCFRPVLFGESDRFQSFLLRLPVRDAANVSRLSKDSWRLAATWFDEAQDAVAELVRRGGSRQSDGSRTTYVPGNGGSNSGSVRLLLGWCRCETAGEATQEEDKVSGFSLLIG